MTETSNTSQQGLQIGPTNSITDIAGLMIGHASDEKLKSGVSVVTADAPFTAAVHVMGAAPGSRETELLAPGRLVEKIDALVLSGGSAFGLAAADGVMDALVASGRGYTIGQAIIPIVPAAILFDLNNGGDKAWHQNPYPALGARALQSAADNCPIGSIGAGCGAIAGSLKGGLGTASTITPQGHIVAALVAVNAYGSVIMPNSRHFWAAMFEVGEEFGGFGLPPTGDPLWTPSRMLSQQAEPEPVTAAALSDQRGIATGNTTIGIIATDATLDKAAAERLAIAAHDGIGRAIVPAHTAVDGDLVFAAATAAKPPPADTDAVIQLGHAAAHAMARAIARGVYAATPAAGDTVPCYAGLLAKAKP